MSTQKPVVWYASYTRFPTEKAHGLYMAKSLDALEELGYSTHLIVPRRFGTLTVDPQQYYQTKHTLPVTKVWTIDLLWLPILKAWWHRLGVALFAYGAYRFLRSRVQREDVVITNDQFLVSVLTKLDCKVVWEIHDYPSVRKAQFHTMIADLHAIQTNNEQKIAELTSDYGPFETLVYAAHNGVDIDVFTNAPAKAAARSTLELDAEETYVLYTGHLYEWKGVHTLAAAAAYLTDVTILFVGGTAEDVAQMRAQYKEQANIKFVGHRPPQEIPLWQAAADVLVLPNTATMDISARYTSPMKTFEYLASGRMIVASDIPSIREILNDETALFAPADEPETLAEVIKKALSADVSLYAKNARAVAAEHTWEKRADKIVHELKL